ncbi:MAG TPA: DUF3300 domain-containing protein [Steroidobacteraceae bacterium]|nr:DUF3300 domain-containing protein [Steroidobacteraceae bacterium]
MNELPNEVRGAGRSRQLTVALLACACFAAGCGKKTAQPPQESATHPQVEAPAPPAPAITQESWAPDALEELLAPIALYPDLLVGWILAASVNTQEVLDAGNWLLQNEGLQGPALESAAQQAGFGTAMRALLQFPSVVDMLCQQIDWTRQVGAAFASDQQAVLDAIQRLRAQAVSLGNFTSTPQQTVETVAENDQIIIEVKPADPEEIYVPTYDPEVIYWDYYGTGTYYGVYGARLIAFGLGVIIGHAIHDACCYPIWSYGALYAGPRPFYPPAYRYRPVYGPGFHPARGYVSPPGYRHSFTNVNLNVNQSIVASTERYYSRFGQNQNLRGGEARSPLANAKPVDRQALARQAMGPTAAGQNRASQAAGMDRADSWRGQSTYAGQRDGAANEAFNQAAAEAAAFAKARQAAAQRSAGDLASGPRAPPENLGDIRSARVDRGYGDSARVTSRDVAVTTRDTRPSQTNTVSSGSSTRDRAFSSADRERNGSFDRAASARGHASAGSRPARAARGGRGR